MNKPALSKERSANRNPSSDQIKNTQSFSNEGQAEAIADEEVDHFFALSPDMLCVADMNGCFKKINKAFNRLLEYDRGSILGQKVYSFIHVDDREFTRTLIESLSGGNQTVQFESRLVTKHKSIRWISWNMTLVVKENLLYGVGRDITDSKNLENALKSEKRRFSDMFNTAPVTMCILIGEKHVFESANDLYYKFSGRKNIIGKPVREVFPEAEGQGIFELMDHVYKTGEIYSISERCLLLDVNGDGELEEVYLTFMFQPFRNPDGEVEGIFYFGVDVTEQVKARKKIEESQKQFVDLLQNLPAAVYTCDPGGKILLYNRAASQLWQREPVIGKDFWFESFEMYDAEGIRIPHENSSLARSLKEGKPKPNQEIIIKRPDGSMRHVVAFPSPIFDFSGALIGGINVLIDITDRKLAEEELEKLSLIARKTTNAIIMTSPNGIIEWVNEAFTEMTGYQFGEVVGKRKSFLHGRETDTSTLKFMAEKVKKSEPFECEILKYSKSGKSFWVKVEGHPIFDSKGKLLRYFDIETNITERKRAFEKLVKTELEVRTFANQLNNLLEEERTRIAREIHDELGQQLTGLKMSLSSLRNIESLEPGTKKMVAHLVSDVEKSIKSLRKISTELRPAILDTLGLIPSVEWMAKEFQKKTGLTCHLKIQATQQHFDKEVSIVFFRVCQEALTNISKHAEANKVTIHIVQNAKELCLKITDNGKGIRNDKLEDPFSMGLIGMRERANLIGSQLKITNNSKSGTTIQIVKKLDG